QLASPIDQLTFLGDNVTIAFIGRDSHNRRQVFTINTRTRALRQLTDHPTDVQSFIVNAGGALRAFSAVLDIDDREARRAKMDGDGGFLWDRTLFQPGLRELAPARAFDEWPHLIRQYFLGAQSLRRAPAAKAARPFYDSREARSLTPLDLNDP